MTQRERIERMERIFDEASAATQALSEALARYRALGEEMDALEAYYTGGTWLRDYEDDEAGKLPEDLKRGVLSQDAVYDWLGLRNALREALRQM